MASFKFVKMSTGPESLSKEKLKSELRKRGVVFSHSENKAYYVELYRSEVMGRDSYSSLPSDNPRAMKKQVKVHG